MPRRTTQRDDATSSLWNYVPLDEHVAPTHEVGQQVRSRLADVWAAIRGEDEDDSDEAEPFRPCPEATLDRLVPRPDWTEALPSLREALAPDATSPDVPTVIVGAPHSGTIATLLALARARDWHVVEPPTIEEILSRETDRLAEMERTSSPWVLPRLEKCYLRHTQGLSFVRDLLDAYNDGVLGRGLVGCNTWAWAYLQHVWPGRIDRVLTLQAFDAARLARWFRQLAGEESDFAREFLQFDEATDDSPSADPTPDSARVESFLNHLASYSRGIPGVARSLWRRSLVADPATESSTSDDDGGRDGPACVAGAYDWSQFEPPSMPSDTGGDARFVLHAILLHGGLTADTLVRLLPLTRHAIRQALHELGDAELVARDENVWQVTPQGYPAVRRSLREHGYIGGDP